MIFCRFSFLQHSGAFVHAAVIRTYAEANQACPQIFDKNVFRTDSELNSETMVCTGLFLAGGMFVSCVWRPAGAANSKANPRADQCDMVGNPLHRPIVYSDCIVAA